MGISVLEKKIFKEDRGKKADIALKFHILIFHGKTTIPLVVGHMIKVVEHDLGFLGKI